MYAKIFFFLCASIGCTLFAFSLDGTSPPHAVDVKGTPIPASGITQPSEPIILAKDSKHDTYGELRAEAAFDHNKHATDPRYSLNGKAAMACTECHHTSQPSAPKGQEYLKKFDRKEILTAKELETSKLPVLSCRECHFQEATKATAEYPPAGFEYPKSMKRDSIDRLTNFFAYHINCKDCHAAAKKRNSKLRPPTRCADCHTEKTIEP